MSDYSLIDCHTHLTKEGAEAGTRLLSRAAEGGIDSIAILVIAGLKARNGNPAGLLAKARHPDRIFLFAGLDYTALAEEVEHRFTFPFGKQVERLIAIGCDGVKMLNGKPDVRRASGIALDSPVYEACFARLAETGMPLLWHVNDPEEFWNPDLAPEWARKAGWLYDDSFPSKESLYGECQRVLRRHPNLKVIFAHFHFLSADLPRAAALLERFSNACFDLAPGIEMFHNFSAAPEIAREFFLRYQERIIFGTDLVEDSPLSRIRVIRNCLESDETFPVPTDERLFWPDYRTTLRGLRLPPEVLGKIYADNFRRLVGNTPRPLNLSAAREELERIASIADQLGISPNTARQAMAALV